MKFKGYALMRLVKAIGDSNDAETNADYEVEVFGKFGTEERKVMKLAAIDREYGKMRMKGDRCAIMMGGEVELLDDEDFAYRLAAWKLVA